MPIVSEPITLKFMAGKPPTTAKDYNDVLVWKTYQDMSGIEVDWELVPTVFDPDYVSGRLGLIARILPNSLGR